MTRSIQRELAVSASRQSDGFTIVELIITILVAGIFLASIFSLFSTVMLFATTTAQRNTASDLAYANMRLYANSAGPTWFTCPATETAAVTVKNSTGNVPNLPGSVQQTVTASALYGCAGDNSGLPVRVISTVIYDNGQKRVSHATYTSL